MMSYFIQRAKKKKCSHSAIFYFLCTLQNGFELIYVLAFLGMYICIQTDIQIKVRSTYFCKKNKIQNVSPTYDFCIDKSVRISLKCIIYIRLNKWRNTIDERSTEVLWGAEKGQKILFYIVFCKTILTSKTTQRIFTVYFVTLYIVIF